VINVTYFDVGYPDQLWPRNESLERPKKHIGLREDRAKDIVLPILIASKWAGLRRCVVKATRCKGTEWAVKAE
jgi:hypothetical protein